MANGDHDWTAGETVTAANVDDYLQLQTVQKFATAAARNAALAARAREGLHTYQDDTNTDTVYSGAAWSTVGPVHGALTAWTPAVTQSGAVTVTVSYATYSRLGRRVFYEALVVATGAGSAANDVTITLPVTAAATVVGLRIGSGTIQDVSAPQEYWGPLVATSTTVTKIKSTNGALNTYLGNSVFTLALAAGDAIFVNGSYEAASDA